MDKIIDTTRLRLRAYLAVNARYGQPLVYEINGKRGFFSEINNLLNALVYGLVERRRMIVDCKQIGDWSDFFTSHPPSAPDDILHAVPKEWVIDGITPQFRLIRELASASHRSGQRLLIPPLWLFGRFRSIKRAMAKAVLSRPAPSVMSPAPPFAVFHMRMGDKIATTRHGKKPEGEATAPQTYMDILRTKAPAIRSIFVMTDDYTAVELLRQVAPDYSVTTFCLPQERGYDQKTFMGQHSAHRTDSIRRLLDETDVAIRSDLFLGGFKSNVARFICLMHDDPERCFSVDGMKDWTPL